MSFLNILPQSIASAVAAYKRQQAMNQFVNQVQQNRANTQSQIAMNGVSLLDLYTYTPLPGPTSIRLLTLKKDDACGYSCSLSVFELESAPPYQALSYTWGDPSQFPELEGLDLSMTGSWASSYDEEVRFKIDGKGVVIKPGRSLHEALSRLLHADTSLMEHRYLWVDALCINQRNDPEREAQVLMMGEIYSRATKVISWLGIALDSTSKAIEALEKLGRLTQARWERMRSMDMTDVDVYRQLGIAPISETERKSLSGFLMRGWFSRVWIIQEAVFARNIVFVCGEYVISSDLLFRVSKMLVLMGWSNQLMILDTPDIATKQMVPPGGIAAVALMREEFNSPERPSPLNIMVSTRSRQATKSEDSVYGVLNVVALSMLKEPRDLLVQPDVSKKIEEVMENATLMLIRHEGDLTVLHQVQERSLRTIRNCSSWTVNWRQRMIPQPLVMAAQTQIPWNPARSNKKQNLDCTSAPRRLQFQAARVSVIAATTPDSEALGDDVSAWLKLAIEMGNKVASLGQQGIFEILWRTLVADVVLDRHPAPDDVGDALVRHCLAMHCHRTERFWAVRAGVEDALFCETIRRLNAGDRGSPFPSHDDVPALLWAIRGDGTSLEKGHVKRFFEKPNAWGEQFARRMDSVMLSRCLARLERNNLAAVPASSQVGDEVWIIPNLQTPFVLRAVENGEYELVGEAYVHGIMHGEIASDFVFQDITLR